MTIKSTAFDNDLQEVAQIAKLLSHPARLAILKYLAETTTCISGDIAQELPLSRTTVSQHLQELKKAGWIKGEITGTRISYCIDFEAFEKSKNQLEDFFREVNANKSFTSDCGQ